MEQTKLVIATSVQSLVIMLLTLAVAMKNVRNIVTVIFVSIAKESEMMKSFKCPKCGFFFSLEADFENMSDEEYKEVSGCPCGKQMEEVEYSVDMIPTIDI